MNWLKTEIKICMVSKSVVDSLCKQFFHWFYCKMFRFWFTSYFMSISQPTWTLDSRTSKSKQSNSCSETIFLFFKWFLKIKMSYLKESCLLSSCSYWRLGESWSDWNIQTTSFQKREISGPIHPANEFLTAQIATVWVSPRPSHRHRHLSKYF